MHRKVLTILLASGLILYFTKGVFAANNVQPAQPMNTMPGSPWANAGKQSGGRWLPGHFEVKDGRRTWIRGHYETTSRGSAPLSVPTNSDGKTTQDAKAGPSHNSLQGFVRPFDSKNQNNGQAKSQGQWIPGHFETVNGLNNWVRGHYAGQKNAVAGPPKELLNTQAADQQLNTVSVRTQGWAVVIGISKYQNSAGQFSGLRYAASDAEMFYNFLLSPEGGGFPPERILFLKDEDATLQNIKYAFFDFLKKALEEDFVMIYFAGHGVPEQGSPENLYLLAHDTQPDRLASTAFPMWDIETALKRYIKSEKVVMLADACHSAGISGDITTRGIDQTNQVTRHLLEVARAKKGRAIFTASEAGELSQESKKWGNGRGVFTHFLLEGLNGKADVNDDSIVTLGEAIDFVSENVRRSTNNSQHPDTAGVFDRGFPMAVLNKH